MRKHFLIILCMMTMVLIGCSNQRTEHLSGEEQTRQDETSQLQTVTVKITEMGWGGKITEGQEEWNSFITQTAKGNKAEIMVIKENKEHPERDMDCMIIRYDGEYYTFTHAGWEDKEEKYKYLLEQNTPEHNSGDSYRIYFLANEKPWSHGDVIIRLFASSNPDNLDIQLIFWEHPIKPQSILQNKVF